MKINAKKIVLAGICLLGAYWVVESLKLQLWVRRGPGGGFLPLIAGILCVFFSLFVLIKEWKKEDNSKFDKAALLPIGALLGAILLTYLIGMFLSMIVFMFAWLFWVEKMGLKKSLLVSIIWPGVLYSVFVLWLQSPLPKGMLGLL